MAPITLYCTTWCADCRYAKTFLKERGIAFQEVNIDKNPDAESLVLKANSGKRKVPTIEFDGRFFSCSPFNAAQLACELGIPLNS
ncbi:MAG: glutaredoxin family protein [Acidobacteriia bacterium]|nr:glutaredoxin family protein [Terriglobia bacterium]